MRIILIATISLIGWMTNAQQNFLPLHSFYKDQLFANKLSKPYNEGSFLPANEADYDLIPAINDSSKQFYDITYILFKKHLFEINSKDCYLTISPAADLSQGVDLSDTTTDRPGLFQNTRGVHVEADLFDNFSFSTSFYENQGRYAAYQTNYFVGVGEGYPKADSTYSQQNAVIPGGARTKPFKEDAFDYGFAIGYFAYSPWKFLRISIGNNMQFVGDGHRSLLLSDNSYGAPYFRIDWKISPKLNFNYYRSKQLNLLRRPLTTFVEAYYQPKGFAGNYLTFKPAESFNISLFEGSMWSRGDSVSSHPAHFMYYSPIPLVGALIAGDNASSLLGINTAYQWKKHRFYAQLAINDLNGEKLGYQVGYRGYNFFGLNDFMIQIEYNHVPEEMYEVNSRKLNYSHYNLPLAHSKGSGFDEVILRSNYEWKRIYADLSFVFMSLTNYDPRRHLAVYDDFESLNGQVIYSNVELGYRINRKMNLTCFASYTYRSTTAEDVLPAGMVNFGMRTSLLNRYTDF